jgi:hypothetical protein
MTQGHCNAKSGKIIQIDEKQVRDHLGVIVRGTVQETLNTLLDEEAERLCRAKRYERIDMRKGASSCAVAKTAFLNDCPSFRFFMK